MEAIISVCIGFLLFMIMAFIMYVNGYKKEAIIIRNSSFYAVLGYIYLVFIIGFMPIN